MRNYIKKLPWIHFYILLGIIFLYFTTRLYHIQTKNLPIFIDEATYAQWAQVGKFDPSQRLLSLVDGLEPMFVWLTIVFMGKISSPVIAGRLVSIFSGSMTLIGLYFLAKELYQKKTTAAVSSLLYALFPFALVLDRMAIYVSLFGAFFIWSIYFSVILVRYLKTENAFILGIILSGGLLTKISGFISIYLLPVNLLLFNFRDKRKIQKLFRWVVLCILAVVLALLYYSVLQLSSQTEFLREKSNRFLYSLPEVLKFNIFHIVAANIKNSFSWLTIYFSIPWILLLLSSIFLKHERRQTAFLWFWFLIPFMSLMVLGKSIYPRYLFFMSLPLLILIAEAFVQILGRVKKRIYIIFLIFISFVFVCFSDFKIMTDFPRAPIPQKDLFQYVNGWPAGGGVTAIVDYLQNESKKGKIIVYSEGLYGSLPKAIIDIYFKDNPNVIRSAIDGVPKKMPADILTASKTVPTYIIINQVQNQPNWPIMLIAKYRKGVGNSYIRLYKVI